MGGTRENKFLSQCVTKLWCSVLRDAVGDSSTHRSLLKAALWMQLPVQEVTNKHSGTQGGFFISLVVSCSWRWRLNL